MTLYILYNTNHVVNQFFAVQNNVCNTFASAIKVSCDKVFIGCKNQDIKNLEVKVENQMNAATEDYAKIVEV